MVLMFVSHKCLFRISSVLFYFTGHSRSAFIIALTLVVYCSPVLSAPRFRKSTAPRWHEPCGGKRAVGLDLGNIWDMMGGGDYEDDTQESISQLYHDLARKSTHVKDKIFQLKDKMVSLLNYYIDMK